MAETDKIFEMKEPYTDTSRNPEAGGFAPAYSETHNDQADILRLGKKQEFKASTAHLPVEITTDRFDCRGTLICFRPWGLFPYTWQRGNLY